MPREHKKSGHRSHRGAEGKGPAGATSSRNSNSSAEPALPTLTFNEGRADIQTNFLDCKEKWSIHLKKTYGNAGRLLELKKHYEPPRVAPPVLTLLSDEEKALAKELHREECKLRLRLVADLQAEYPKIYAFLMGQMSEQSKARVKTVVNWNTIESDNDPEALWIAIEQTHMAAVTQSAASDKARARQAYSEIRQSRTESVADLKKRFDSALLVYDAVGQKKPPDEEIAADFVSKLDPFRFATMKALLENSKMMTGTDNFPKTLADAYNMAAEFKVPVQADGGQSMNIVSAGSVSGSAASAAAFSTTVSKKKAKKAKSTQKQAAKGDSDKAGKASESQSTESTEIICWGCGEAGHKLNNCPEIKANKEEHQAKTKKGSVHFTATSKRSGPEVSDLEGLKVFLAGGGVTDALRETKVGIDTMASDHVIVNRRLLRKVWKSPYNIEISGVGGTVSTNMEGEMSYFGTVNWCNGGAANLLSFARLSEDFDIDWDQDQGVITVHSEGQMFEFKREENLFVCDMGRLAQPDGEVTAMIQTVEGNEKLYTKRQVQGAERARLLCEELGFVSNQDLVKLVKRGILGCDVTVPDVYRALRIYGESLGNLRGKTKRSNTKHVDLESVPKEIDVNVTLHVDIMFVENIPFLIAVIAPMSMTMVQLLGSRKLSDVKQALLHMIGRCRAEGFVITTLLTDGEGAISKLTDELLLMGINVNPSGAGSHVPVVENKIKTVKERVRGHIATMPFKLCISLLVWLVYFCVSRINLVPTSTMSTDYVAPREAFNGSRLDYKRDLGLKFGEYCEVHEQYLVTNTMAPRTRPAIALMSKGNKQGSWQFMALDTFRVITRDHWTKLPMPDSVIKMLNEKARLGKKSVSDEPIFTLGNLTVSVHDRGENPAPIKNVEFKQVSPRGDAVDFEPLGVMLEETTKVEVSASNGLEPAEQVMINEGVAFADDVGDGEPVNNTIMTPVTAPVDEVTQQEPGHNFQDPASAVGGTSEGVTVSSEPVTEEPQRAGRGGRAIRRDYRRDATMLEKGSRKWAYQLTVNKALEKFGKDALKSLCAELLQMHQKRVWKPVKLTSLSIQERRKIIRSSMFLKEKYLSTGEFDKLKARLVAGGHMQDRSIYTQDDTEAPTASLQSVYMVAAMAAHEGRAVMTADITGAYLNADMKKDIHMKLEPKLAEVLAAMEPSYGEYINADGTLIVKLTKALYGCVESAKLWYDNIAGFLRGEGFVQNARDRCVFNKVVGGNQVTVCIYVDDLLVTCKDADVIQSVMSKLRETYKDITVHEGLVHSYLGQTFDFSVPKKVKITMEGYVNDFLEEYEIEGCASTPGTDKLFTVDATSEPLAPDQAEIYHSRVAKLLYLAKRVRPDIMTSVAFLSTRVMGPTAEDLVKLNRVFRYINGTKDMGICLEAGAGVTILAYIDASFAVHGDMRSHTGGVISLGSGPVYVRSSKQKLTSKSSTEAELIGVSDMLPQVIWTRDFLQQQGYMCKPAKIFQDNQSTIVLANKGFSTSDKTRHIGIRYYFVKDRIDGGEVEVEYLATENMIADIMTKPLQGSLFRKLRDLLMNWN